MPGSPRHLDQQTSLLSRQHHALRLSTGPQRYLIYRYRGGVSRGGFEGQRLNPLMADKPVSICKTSLNILTFQPRISKQNRIECVTCSEHAENMLNSKPATSHNRLTTEYFRVDCNPLKQKLLIHSSPRVSA
ncbi:protein of unknown function [Nitrospira japonica]|uniref:Uncharacterized protein n=1 Tax=Nitrospira japonica TaxID=1325564 RepID=A0A1W1HZN3_9BACT|nr:protein of unknown function [Nitrospira japonica]